MPTKFGFVTPTERDEAERERLERLRHDEQERAENERRRQLQDVQTAASMSNLICEILKDFAKSYGGQNATVRFSPEAHAIAWAYKGRLPKDLPSLTVYFVSPDLIIRADNVNDRQMQELCPLGRVLHEQTKRKVQLYNGRHHFMTFV